MAEPAEVVIRPAELRDVRSMRNIDREAYRTPWSEAMTVDQVTKPARVHLVAESAIQGVKGIIVGHGGVLFLHDEAHISTIVVDGRYQRQGIGLVLLHGLLEAAAATRCSSVTLEVRASNCAAISLYQRCGFVEVGRRPRYYEDNGEDAILFTLQQPV